MLSRGEKKNVSAVTICISCTRSAPLRRISMLHLISRGIDQASDGGSMSNRCSLRWEVCMLLCVFCLCKQLNLHARRGPTRTRKKSSPQRASFVTLMIIYNSQVPCLCGPHSAAAWRLHAHLANNIRWWVSKKKKNVESRGGRVSLD